jgi:hypothetical protein
VTAPRDCAGLADCCVQAVHGAAVASRDKVPVDGQREGRGVMPELLLNVLEGLAGLDQ